MSDASQEPSFGESNSGSTLEERKFQLEIQKFDYEKSKSRGLKFFNANLGIIITAMIGVATIVVSYLQLEINRQSSAQQLLLQKSISDGQLDLEKSKAQAAKEADERKLELEIAKLLLEKKTDINTEDVQEVYYLRDIVMSTLPNDVGVRITRKMADNASTNAVRSAWLDGLVKLSVNIAVSAGSSASSTMTLELVIKQFPVLDTTDGRARVADILEAAQEFNLQDSAAALLAYVLHSTSFFRSTAENLKYSPERLVQIFPKIFPTSSEAAPFSNNPQGLANRLYGGRYGNIAPDDGWKFRGRGYLRTIGRENYEKSSKLLSVDLLTNPDKLLESKVAAREAAAVFICLGKPATVDGTVRQLNGALVGFAGVQSIYEKLNPAAPKVTQGIAIPPSLQVETINNNRLCTT